MSTLPNKKELGSEPQLSTVLKSWLALHQFQTSLRGCLQGKPAIKRGLDLCSEDKDPSGPQIPVQAFAFIPLSLKTPNCTEEIEI